MSPTLFEGFSSTLASYVVQARLILFISRWPQRFVLCQLNAVPNYRTNLRQITEKLVLPTKNVPFFTQKTGQNICRAPGPPRYTLILKNQTR